MVQYSCTETTNDDSSNNDDTEHVSKDEEKDDDPEDDSTFKCWCCKRCSRRWEEEDWRKMIVEEDPVEIDDEMYDGVPKLPMTYRVSPVSCTVVIVVVATTIKYLPS